MMTPTVGRIVHYTNLGDKDGKYPPEIQAAIVTKVHAGAAPFACSLAVLYPTGLFFLQCVEQTDAVPGSNEARGFWNWPERT